MASRNGSAVSQSRSQTTSSFIVRMKRSATAFPVGRPTGANVCTRPHFSTSAAQSKPV